jgi:predicted transcriptional regulator
MKNEMIETVYAAGKYISENDVTEIQFQILKALQEQGTLTRYEIMKIIGRPGSTVHENLVKLVQKGYIVDQVRIIEKKGRPTYYFKIKDDYAQKNN